MCDNTTISIFYFLVLLLLASCMLPEANAMHINKTVQSPEGDQLVLSEDGISKVTYRLWSDHPDFAAKRIVLEVKIGPFRKYKTEQSADLYSIVFNTCTDSSEFELLCQEVQVSTWPGASLEFDNITFLLTLVEGNVKTVYQNLSIIHLIDHPRHTATDFEDSTNPTTDTADFTTDFEDPTTNTPGSMDTRIGGLTGAGVGGYVIVGVLILIGGLLLTGLILVFIKISKARRPKNVNGQASRGDTTNQGAETNV